MTKEKSKSLKSFFFSKTYYFCVALSDLLVADIFVEAFSFYFDRKSPNFQNSTVTIGRLRSGISCFMRGSRAWCVVYVLSGRLAMPRLR